MIITIWITEQNDSFCMHKVISKFEYVLLYKYMSCHLLL